MADIPTPQGKKWPVVRTPAEMSTRGSAKPNYSENRSLNSSRGRKNLDNMRGKWREESAKKAEKEEFMRKQFRETQADLGLKAKYTVVRRAMRDAESPEEQAAAAELSTILQAFPRKRTMPILPGYPSGAPTLEMLKERQQEWISENPEAWAAHLELVSQQPVQDYYAIITSPEYNQLKVDFDAATERFKQAQRRHMAELGPNAALRGWRHSMPMPAEVPEGPLEILENANDVGSIDVPFDYTESFDLTEFKDNDPVIEIITTDTKGKSHKYFYSPKNIEAWFKTQLKNGVANFKIPEGNQIIATTKDILPNPDVTINKGVVRLLNPTNTSSLSGGRYGRTRRHRKKSRKTRRGSKRA